MPRVTRRGALVHLLSWTAGLAAVRIARGQGRQGLDQFLQAPPCKDEKLTPSVAVDPPFRSDAPMRTSLVEPGMTGPRMRLSGYVIGLKCGRIKGARVDFWQADAAGVVPQKGVRGRGRQLTDAEGRFTLETVMPGAPAGRARRLSARVEPPGKPALTTVLFFPGDPAAAKEKAFAPSLVMRRVVGVKPDTYAFDFVLDL